MTTHSPDSEQVHWAYLLDTLDPTERDGFEDAVFGDDVAYEALLASESALIDAYVEDTLSEPQRDRFKSRLSEVPSWPQRVSFARTLFKTTRPQKAAAPLGRWARLVKSFTEPGGFSRLVGVAAMVVVVAVGARLMLAGKTGGTTELTLTSVVRSEQTVPTVQLEADAVLALTLGVDPDEAAQAFDIVVIRAEQTILTQRVNRSGDQVHVKLKALQPGPHTVWLRDGKIGVAYYDFVIER
ncbi:MAG: hypothetical protein ACI9MR_003351 [Myxococcota bacterium]|jgi:hypothetical protein